MTPKILIVDDLIENLISLEAILEDFDVQFVRALSGEEALIASTREDFALAILDVQMPGMNGYETLELMRQRKKTKYLPVIFISAIHQSDLNIIKGIETGAVDFIPKPIIPTILQGKVRVFLDLFLQRNELDTLLHRMEVTNEELKIAKEHAEKENRTKTIFLSNMTHEIRTPMNGVLGLSKILQKTTLTTDQKELLSIITTAGENLLQIVNDILDFSKIEMGQLKVEAIPFNLVDLLNSVHKLLNFKAVEKSIQFTYVYDPELPKEFIGDPHRINQILINLANNAIKFTEDGRVTIKVTKQHQCEDNLTVHFSVEDTGIGISEEGKGMLFKEFSQTEPDIARRFGGTGLGLAISKNLVTLMEGKIGVNSTLGQGSQFWFSLPLKSAIMEEHELISEEALPQIGLKVLVAEDNRINQMVAKLILAQFDVKIDIAPNGKEAVRLYKENKYPMIFMDMLMPEMNGLEATLKIREFEKATQDHHPAYIVAATANAHEEDEQKCRDAGMNRFLCKPFSEKDLVRLFSDYETYTNTLNEHALKPVQQHER